MVTSRFGHSLIAVDDFLAEAEILKAAWVELLNNPNAGKIDYNLLSDRLDKATASPYITEKCVRAKQDLLHIWNLLKAKWRTIPVTMLPNGEYITETMYEAGYDAMRDANGITPKDWVLGHAGTVYAAMRAVQPPAVKHVFIPETADEAEAMLRTGYAWLKGNAPERLLEKARKEPMPDPADTISYAETVRMHRPLTNDDQQSLDTALDKSKALYTTEPMKKGN